MAKIKWEQVGSNHIAVVENTGVTLVARWDGVYYVAEVRVGTPARPGSGEMITAHHGSFSLEQAKRETLKAFRFWCFHVLVVAQVDGYGHYIDVGNGEEVADLLVTT